jgi:hypothetical protein
MEADFLKRFYLYSFFLLAILAVGSSIVGNNIKITVGLLFGYLIGIMPWISWHIIIKITKGFSKKGRGWLIFIITLVKYLGIGIALYFAVTRRLLPPAAIITGLSIIIFVLLMMSLIRYVFARKVPNG